MRITNAMMVSQFLFDANDSLNRASKYQEQVHTTQRVSNISDDPQATITALRARNKLSSLDTYQSNISTAGSYLTEAETAASKLNDILQSVYQQIVDAANGDANADDLAAMAEEITSLRDEIVSIGNTTIGTTYLFGGYNFTGTTDATGTTRAPFYVDTATGHLIYNGIDLTQISCADDYENDVSLMSKCVDTILSDITKLAATSLDEYARDTVCAEALEALNNLMYNGEAALAAAKQFGIDPSVSASYQQLSNFVGALADLTEELKNECSLELAGEYILASDPTIQLTADGEIDYDYYQQQGISVLTDEEYANRFNRADAQDILGRVNELIGNTDVTPGVGLDYSMADATTALQGEIDTVLTAAGAEDALAAEAKNRALVQIGVDNALPYTFTGLDLLGSGKDNIYYTLDKCLTMLQSGDTEGLSGMISQVQGAQSAVLNFEIRIGTTQNRLDMISSRYEASEFNYTEMKSDAIDVDMAEAITNYMTAQVVYNAALAAGAEIVQTSLLDFLS